MLEASPEQKGVCKLGETNHKNTYNSPRHNNFFGEMVEIWVFKIV